MVTLKMGGKEYRIDYTGNVEVYIPTGEPRVMKATIPGHFRTIKRDGPVADRVRKYAAKLDERAAKYLERYEAERPLTGAALEEAAVAAGVGDELLNIWRRGRLTDEALIRLFRA